MANLPARIFNRQTAIYALIVLMLICLAGAVFAAAVAAWLYYGG